MNLRNEGPLLELLRRDRLSPRQKALRPEEFLKSLPMYKFLREPSLLDEFDWKRLRRIAIWRENGSVIFISHQYFKPFWDRFAYFELRNIGNYALNCAIYGEIDVLIAETLTFFLSLKHPAGVGKLGPVLYFGSCNDRRSTFNVASLQADQLAQILDSNSTRQVDLGSFVNEKQSEVLASRPYALNLKLVGHNFAFLDYGAAFVDALEKRESSFGSLFMFCGGNRVCLSSANLQRLLKLEYVFEKLEINSPKRECALLPFSAKVNVLRYRGYTFRMQAEDFRSLDIVPTDLSVVFTMGYEEEDWVALVTSFLNRVAQLGHLERLDLSIRCDDDDDDEPFERDVVTPVVEALVRAIRANPNLSCLVLSAADVSCLHWGPHLQSIFKAMEKHKSLRTVVVEHPLGDSYWDIGELWEDEDDEFDSRYGFERFWLGQLLSRNRKIQVLDRSGKKCTDGSTIDELYALNDFYNGSVSLVKETTELRPLLVEATLTESSSKNFQYTALLLSHHMDVLCEFMHTVNIEDTVLSAAVPRGRKVTRKPKRKSPSQHSRAAKKATRDEP